MAIGDIVKVTVVNVNTAGDQMVNQFHYEQVDLQGPLKTPLEGAANAWINQVYPVYADCISIDVGLVEVKARYVPPTPEEARVVPSSGEKGTQTGTPIANQASPIVSWRTNLIGRSYRGRTFMPPCSVLQSDGGGPNTAQNDLLVLFADAAQLVSDIVNLNGIWRLVIWSETLQVATPVTSYVLPDAFGTQRSRREGIGA